MKRKVKPETWVGLFLICGIALILGVIPGFGGIKSEKEKSYPVNIIFKDAAGIVKNTRIQLGGVEVGKVVRAPQLLPSGHEVILHANIKENVQIQQGSLFRIDMQNILGDRFIEIVPPDHPTDDYVQPGDTIVGQPVSDLSKFKQNAMVASEEILTILKRIEANADNIDEALLNISKAAKGMAETTEIINKRLLTEENLTYIGQSLQHLNRLGEQMPQLMDKAGHSLDSVDSILKDAREMIAQLDDRLDDLNPAIKEIPNTLDSLNNAATNISSLTADIRKITADTKNNKNALGLMLYDAEFRRNMQEFLRNLRSYGILRYRNPNEPEPAPDPRAGFSGSRR